MYHYFIGIDISKSFFTVALHGQKLYQDYQNNLKGFKQFNKNFKSHLSTALIILETTGGYEMDLIYFLQKYNCFIHRANTLKVKKFIGSYGTLAKSDRIDALGLALYGQERHARLELFKENPHKKLLKLVQRRNDLKSMLVQEKNRLQAPDQKEFKSSFQAMINAIQKQILVIEKNIEELFKIHPHYEEVKKVLKTINGIGDITATQLIALMPELGTIDRKKIASLAGVAPHPNESGQKKGYRFIRGGRYDVKPVLFIAAMTASRSKSNLGDFYKKLVAAGKKKMVALAALMRKILVIANARIRDHYLQLIPKAQHNEMDSSLGI